MEFASKFALYASSDSEELDVDELRYSDCEEDDLEGGLFGDENNDAPVAPLAPAPAPQAQQPAPMLGGAPPPAPVSQFRQKKRVKVRKADTNVVAIKLGELANQVSLATGDPCFCEGCNVVLSSFSKLLDRTDGEEGQLWHCEFCGVVNELDLDPEEIPKEPSVDYVLVSPTAALDSAQAVDHGEQLVVFCVDTSGSMCVTTEVSGKQKIKGSDRLDKLRRQYADGFDQNFPQQKKDVTWISRLQCVQAAIASQLDALQKQSPNLRVALITFNGDVCIVGDGVQESVTVAGAKLENADTCWMIGADYPLNTPISKSAKGLTERIFSLEEGGPTALGPALMAGVGMASRCPGSRVVVCTDGMANVGVGTLEDLVTDAEKQTAEQFYDELGERASKHGVSVSVVSIKGSDCRMENLGSVADASKGSVELVDPNNLTKEFASILEEKVVATRVTVDFHLHSGLYVRSTPSGAPTEELVSTTAGTSALDRPSHLSHHVGIATESMDVTFEYGIKKTTKKKAEKAETPDASTTTSASAAAAAVAAPPPVLSEKEKKNAAKLAKKMEEKQAKDARKAAEKERKLAAAAAKKAAKAPVPAPKPAPAPAPAPACVPPPVLPDPEDEQTVDGDAPPDDHQKKEVAELEGEAEAEEEKKKASPDRLPFQVQIRYTRDNTPCIRVITAQQQCTTDRDAAEEAANLELLASHSIQRGAQMAMEGDYTNARLHNFENKQLMKRCAKSEAKTAQYSWWKKNAVHKLETELRTVQRTERASGLNLSDSEEDEKEDAAAAPASRRLKKKAARRQARSDSTATTLYQMSNPLKFKTASSSRRA
mmetsp:Transcript_33344/g.83779  ORF Transcript_33344/g.83779 Transcript_33344/m.83779 type:complete len:826 (-) Transcript_33344:85-2562(-)|eukprot:CAMPEP_0177681500 /NCGR_PEP_ID=MMETSP0447-20121125/30754_1 /TAXON_ID=0 /ORGANISM="Stygamoeba regulata, Strain BSH-02190019" /LENGTH=825 /DNA_ID=CAMNT_0019190931 /DNA_START=124 /DNA_END=2601 /DNA_ORIENTATION=+